MLPFRYCTTQNSLHSFKRSRTDILVRCTQETGSLGAGLSVRLAVPVSHHLSIGGEREARVREASEREAREREAREREAREREAREAAVDITLA